ncbi:MAG: ABC transporter ATP-binding protein [Culturomica sp.]|jgi:lipoprotein-releasing system ATP-binding protein|nr:ABC transporter ATP-binding protein [Culturomica sp.]
MIRVEGIEKSYRELNVLKGIDLLVREKEIVSISGASGAGKTTLLQIIGTLDRPDSGEIWYEETRLSSLSAGKLAAFRNHHIGFVFQFHHLLPEFTAVENVCMPGWIKGVSKKEAEKRATGLLELLGLRERLSHKPNELSGGEQQRVSVARALMNNPKVILADEPSGNLDTATKGELHRLFFSLRDELGQTFVIVTHDTELAGMSDRQVQMKDGVILPENPMI